MNIQRLTPEQVRPYRQLRLRALSESPTAFGSSRAEEARYPLETFVARLQPSPAKWVFGAFEGQRMVGVVTLIREARRKERHKAGIFGLYVDPKVRGRGLGRALLERALEAARRMRGLRQVRLAVVASNLPALRLYESLGFRIYGREADALRVAGQFHDELFLARPV